MRLESKRTTNGKREANKTTNFCEVGERKMRGKWKIMYCKEMRFVIRNLVYVEDPPRQQREKLLLMLLEATSVYPQKGRDDAA